MLRKRRRRALLDMVSRCGGAVDPDDAYAWFAYRRWVGRELGHLLCTGELEYFWQPRGLTNGVTRIRIPKGQR